MIISSEHRQELSDYSMHGKLPCTFLRAIISNDLFGVIEAADSTNVNAIPIYVNYVYNRVPAVACGSRTALTAWHEASGQQGINKRQSKKTKSTFKLLP